MKKVFCSKCIYFAPGGFDKLDGREFLCCGCEYPENRKSNWHSEYSLPIKHPSEINKNNDCMWYVECLRKSNDTPL